jgi:hypothetical protein
LSLTFVTFPSLLSFSLLVCSGTVIWYIICKDEFPILEKHPCKISERMVSCAFFDYRIASVAIFWGAPASLDLGIIDCFFPCFLTDARPLNSIAVLFILLVAIKIVH